MTMKKDEIDIITDIMTHPHVGIIQRIEQLRLKEICRYFDIPITKENFAYCMSVKAVFDGFLATMYSMADSDSSIKDPDGMAYDLTAIALGLFKKSRKLPQKSKELLALFEKKVNSIEDTH